MYSKIKRMISNITISNRCGLVLLIACSLALSCNADVVNSEENDININNNNNIKPIQDTIVIGQWNIGHFSGGENPNSKIKGNNYSTLLEECRGVISSMSADIVSLNEFSIILGTDKSNKQHKTEDVVLNEYCYKYIGHQSGYSCNALFSTIELINSQEREYVCNQTAHITHTSAIKATDYYLIESRIRLKNAEVVLVTTHLAFDTSNKDVACNQIREIIEYYKDADHVILCGDWNIFDVTYFSLFTDAGFQMANHGKFGDFVTWQGGAVLDNIIVKGYDIVDAKMLRVTPILSDHNPIIAKITL